MEISVIGISHRTAPVHVRDQVSLPGELALQLLYTIRSEKIFREALVLDTCNRTELYFMTTHREDPLGHLLAHTARLKGTSPVCDTSLFYRHDGLGAVSHLFRVTASLDSQIVGEDEILGQVKKAYRMAVRAGTARFLLNKLLHRALHVGKRVRTETDLARRPSSVPQAGGELSRQIFCTLAAKRVLLVGAGQTAELAARALIRAGAGTLIVANRTLRRAQQLSEGLLQACGAEESASQIACGGDSDPNGLTHQVHPLVVPECSLDGDSSQAGHAGPAARAVDLGQIPSLIAEVDLVVCSTGSSDFVLSHDALAPRLGRIDHPLLIVDIAVPRDVDPRLGELPNLFLHDIDDLDRLVAENIEQRRLEIPKARAIIEQAVQQFGSWLDSLQMVPSIELLQRRFDLLQESEIKRYGKMFGPSERRELEKFARSLCKKILHKPISYLRELSDNHSGSDRLVAVDIIRRIFDLDSVGQNE